MSQIREIELSADGSERLDVILQRALSKLEQTEISRTFVQRLIASGAVRSDGMQWKKASERPSGLIRFQIEMQLLQAPQLVPFDFQLDILHEDEQLIVLNKPAGISMHPGAGDHSHTLANALAHYLGARQSAQFPSDQRPGIVHRLDRDTTGIVVVAKNRQALFGLARQFASRSVERRYVALAYTPPRRASVVRQSDSGSIDRALRRHIHNRTKMEVCDSGGRRALTHFRVIERFAYAALLQLRLETGRTHQIRVHLESVAAPIIGDPLYGDFTGLPVNLLRRAQEFGRQALHAELLAFDHPISNQRMRFESPAPPDLISLLEAFRA